MKILKRILLAIVAIIVLVLLIALFVKKEYTVQRDIVINRPVAEVFEYIRFSKNQENYNKWWKADPNSKREYRGTDGTKGFVVAWDSKDNSVGAGAQEIKNIEPGNRIDFEIRFKRPFEGISQVYMATEPVNDKQTKLTWVFSGKSKYPMNLMNLFIDNMLGKDMQTSLNDLKSILEK